MREMKYSGVEWIGSIPVEWSTKRLKYLVDRKVEQASQNTNYIGLEDIESFTGKRIINSSDKTADGLALKINKGDVIFGKLRPYLAKCYIVPEDGCCSSEFIVMRPEKIDKAFLKYYLLNPATIDAIDRSTYGAKMPRANWDYIGSLQVLSSSEESEISAFLDKTLAKVDQLISTVNKEIDLIKNFMQSFITEVVTKGLDSTVQTKDSGVNWIGDVPASWKVSSLSGVTMEMRNGYVGPTRNLFVDEGIRYIQSLHTKDGKIDFEKHPYYVSVEWADNHPKIHTGDILIVQTGDIGQVALVTEDYDGCNCHALIIASPNTELVIPAYLSYYLRSKTGKELMLSFKTGALLPHLNSGKIAATPVLIPSIKEQHEIIAYLDEKCAQIDRLIAIKQAKIEKLNDYKKSIIYEYVTGKREVQ